MENFLKALLTVEDYVRGNRNKITSVDFDFTDKRMKVHTRGIDSFIDIVESQRIAPVHLEAEKIGGELADKFPYRVALEIEDILFYAILTVEDYENIFLPWMDQEPEFTDEDFVTLEPPRGITNEQWAMKQAGINVYRDFV